MTTDEELTRDEKTFLRRAIELAARSRADGDAPFGSLLVAADGAVLAEDHNTVRSGNDITAHPELKLARWAARELDTVAAHSTTMYTSCEPCVMCMGAIQRSGLSRVVFALSGEQFGSLLTLSTTRTVAMDGPALFDEASAVVAGWVP